MRKTDKQAFYKRGKLHDEYYMKRYSISFGKGEFK